MSLVYFIDGYNVINNKEFLRQAGRSSQDKRAGLLNLIKTSRLTGSPNNRAVLVFDGYVSTDDAILSHKGAVEIIFSKKESADDKIRKLLDGCVNPKIAIVVSDDKEVMFFAKIKGAKAVSVEDFLKIKAAKENKKRDSQIEDSKVDYSQQAKINQELKKVWLDKQSN